MNLISSVHDVNIFGVLSFVKNGFIFFVRCLPIIIAIWLIFSFEFCILFVANGISLCWICPNTYTHNRHSDVPAHGKSSTINLNGIACRIQKRNLPFPVLRNQMSSMLMFEHVVSFHFYEQKEQIIIAPRILFTKELLRFFLSACVYNVYSKQQLWTI